MSDNITFFHGWSYDADFFKGLASELEGACQFFDRGYFHQPFIPVLAEGTNIAVTHSMGLFYLCEYYSLEGFDKIIVLSGFSDFCAGRDASIVVNLKNNLEKNAIKTLRRFALLCDDKDRVIPKADIHLDLLKEDLDILMERNIYEYLLPYRQKIYAVHAEQDKVIPYEYSHVPDCKNIIVENAGHVYNLEHNKNILGVIKSWIME